MIVKEWHAWALIVCFVGLHIPTRFSRLTAAATARESSPVVTATGLGLIRAVLVLFVVVARGGRWALPPLAAATYGPYLFLAGIWGPMAGPLAAAMPLCLPGP